MWFLPTYKRPERCQKVLDRCVETGMTSPGLVIVNGDPTGYDDLRLPPNWKKIHTPMNLGFVGVMNLMFRMNPDLDWYGLMTDDQLPVTPGWDQRLIETAGKTNIAYTNDWQAGQRISGIPCFGGDLLRAISFWAPECLWHCYCDDFWEQVARDFGNGICLVDVKSDNQHFMNNKADKDETYESSYSRFAEDHQKYQAFLKSHYPLVKKRIAKVIPMAEQKEEVQTKTVNLAGKSILICTPCHGNHIVSEYVHGLCHLIPQLVKHGIGFGYSSIPNESIISRARNALVAAFLSTDTHSHLLFIDADMGFMADDVMRLLAWEKDIIAAVGVRKSDGDPSFCVNLSSIEQEPVTGLLTVDEVGTGMMLISREAIKKMVEAYPKHYYIDRATGTKVPALFDTRIIGEDYWSEDYIFCKRWRAIGGKIFIDQTIALKHVGMKAWTGQLHSAMLKPPPKETKEAAE